jgi:phage tail sheath protein FI
MSNALLSSKTIITESTSGIRTIPSLITAVLAMVGVTQRGPIGVAQFYFSWDAWRRDYGDVTADCADTWNSVSAYFDAGGQYLWFTRTAHYSDITDALSLTADTAEVTANTIAATAAKLPGVNAAPYALAHGDNVSIAVDGGSPVTATFNGTASSSVTSASAPYVLSNGLNLTVQVDGGATQTVTFLTADFISIGAATPAEVAAKLNAILVGVSATSTVSAVTLRSDKKGTASLVNVTGGTAAAALGFGAAVAGTGNVANLAAVTLAEVISIVGALAGLSVVEQSPSGSGIPDIVSDTTGVSSELEITASAGVQTAVGWASGPVNGTAGSPVATLIFRGKTPGAYANDLTIEVADATDLDPDHFNLIIRRNGLIVEQFPNCSMDDADARYVETALAAPGIGSALILAEDQDAGGSERPQNGTYTPTGGDDGLVGLADIDFVGNSASETGIRSLDTVNDATLLAIPQRATAAVANAMVSYCEITRNKSIFPLIECPAGMNALAIVNYVKVTTGLFNTTEFGFIAWPRVKVLNPNKAVFGAADSITIPNTGLIAGMCARQDNARPGGIYIAPCGIENGRMPTIVGLEDDPDGNVRHQVLKEEVRDYVYPALINPIDTQGGALNLDGTRTLRSGGNFTNIAARRGVIFIEQSIKLGTDFARHRNNTEELRAEVERTITNFLLAQMKVGAFKTKNPATAFYVDVDVQGIGLNTPDVVASGQLKARVGLNTNDTVEWVVLDFTKDTRALEQLLANG